MRKRTFMLSGLCCVTGTLSGLLAAVWLVAEPVDDAKKPEVLSTNQSAAAPGNAIQPAPGDLSQNTNSASLSTNAASAALVTEEVRAMIRGAIEELRSYVGESSREILDRTTRDANDLSRKVDETLSTRLDLVERALASNQQRHLEALRDANRGFLMQAGIFGGLGFLGFVVAAMVLSRAINRFSKAALSLPGERLPVVSAPHVGLGATDPNAPLPAQFEQASTRFAESVERLLKRVEEWEQMMGRRFAAEQKKHSGNGPRALATESAPGGDPRTRGTKPADAESSASNEAQSEVSVLLGKGHALLNLGQAREAISCFDKAIALDPRNAGAFVKRGLALEKLQEMQQAVENYDRAIALDDSFTLAYLYKGAVFGKLQRFQEALACYEKALKAEQKMLVS